MLATLFIIYLLIFGHLASTVLDGFFGFASNFSKKVLGIFIVLVSLGWIAGAAILFLPLNFWVWGAVFVLNALIYILLARWAQHKEKNGSQNGLEDDPGINWTTGTKLGVLAFLSLVLYGFYVLYSSRTGEAVLTPWQTIKPEYIVVFFLSTFILGLLILKSNERKENLFFFPSERLKYLSIFPKLKTRTIIFFLILQTFLLHSYLPLTHKLIYGADGWRHMANEERFLQGKMFKAAELRGENNVDNKYQVSSIKYQVKTKIGQLSYSNFWAVNVLLAAVFKTDLLAVTKWFLPILWSLVFPFILFELGIVFGWGVKRSLFFSWLGLLPFAWQAAGSFSLPVSFGLLTWLFFILLLLRRINAPRKEQKLVLVLAGLGLIFGYALYFILFWLAWVVVEVFVLSLRGRSKATDVAIPWNGTANKGIASSLRLLAMTIVVGLSIPVIELIAGYSQFDENIQWLSQIKQVLGNFFGLYLVSGPRSHDIAFGNIIFNQTPLYAFVPNLFTQWRWWIVAFAVCFFAVTIYGCIKAWRDSKVVSQWFAIMSAGIIGGYIITNYFLAGSHILARRLDGVVALFLVGSFCYGLYELLFKINMYPTLQNSRLIKLYIHRGGIFILSVAIAASYSLGPDTGIANAHQYEAAAYVWSREKTEAQPCVLGDTYFLLALEAISAKEIIGGNFPIDSNFGQPERVRLFEQMSIAMNNNIFQESTELTKADHCWFVGDMANFQKEGILNTNDFKVFGETAVMRYNIKY